jgi:hypothetical protein
MKLFYKLLCVLLLTMTCAAQASEIEDPVVNQIITNEEGVFLHVGDCWIESEGLIASNDGLMVLIEGNWMPLPNATFVDDCKRGSWQCSRCDRYNLEGVEACAYCGKKRK